MFFWLSTPIGLGGTKSFLKRLISSLGSSPSKFWYIMHCIPYSEFRPSTKKVCSSDLMHCQISIFEIKMMEKIGINIMPFSNPMSHRYWANPFPYLGTWICTREPGSVLGNLDLNKSLVWDLYLGTWTRTRLCAQKLAQYW